MERFLENFSLPDTVRFRNNKWLGLNRHGKPYTVHVKHGGSVKYGSSLVQAVAKDLGVTLEEFLEWYMA
ncbi:MAG TPA: hypothetical protein VMW83_16130 [Spirochaetia bacterium]|nr:hypothetical protein [Spirochaetia bacterium]